MCKDIKWESAHDKLMILSEFGEGALQGLHGKENERWTEEYQASVYRNAKKYRFFCRNIVLDYRSHHRYLKRIKANFNQKKVNFRARCKKASFSYFAGLLFLYIILILLYY